MDSIFLQGEGERAAFLRHMMQSFGCTYICLWSLPHPSNYLIFLDGVYHEQGNQASSSSGSSLAQRLFQAYCQSVHYVDNGRFPGIAFKNNLPYMELNLQDLQGVASNEVQLQFYVAAGIKTVVLMGCATGEIELGMSSDTRVDFEMQMKNWFPLHFSRQLAPREDPQTTDQKRGSSSSSSLRSLSVDSSEYSSLLFNIPATSLVPPEDSRVPHVENTNALELLAVSSASITTSPLHEAIHTLSQMRNIQFPTVESEDAEITNAILAVLSSSSTSLTPSYQTTQNMPQIPPIISHDPSAFSSYRQGLSPSLMPIAARTNKKQNLFRRAMLFFRNLDIIRRQQEQVQVGKHPTTTQLHHMISERRRREKLNESFQILRSFLPPGSKKDKASVLNYTAEYLSSLKKQVEELSKQNQLLEAQILPPRSEATGDDHNQMRGSSSVERLTNVQITHVSTSTSESRMLDVNLTINGECSLLDLVLRIMDFLKSQNNLSLMSVEANTRPMGESTNSVLGIMFRLRIEGEDFDESSFQEDLEKVVNDVAR